MSTSIFDLGNTVLCDFCNEDYTLSDQEGGLLFGSNGVCPVCAPQVERDAEEYGESQHIRARPNPGESFRDFILRIRGGDNLVTIHRI